LKDPVLPLFSIISFVAGEKEEEEEEEEEEE